MNEWPVTWLFDRCRRHALQSASPAMVHRAQGSGSSGTKREKHGSKHGRRARVARGVRYFAVRMLEMNPTVIVCSDGPSAAFDEALQRKKDWRGTNLQKRKLCVFASRCNGSQFIHERLAYQDAIL